MNKPPGKKQEPKKWHSQQELILKSWGESSSCYRYLHFKAYLKFKSSSMKFTLPIIIISTITGTANFAQETFPDSIREYVPLGIGGLNLFAAILTTVLQFLKVNELLEAHRVASISYGKLARDIKLELSLPRSERHHHGDNMITRCSGEYDRLIEQSPPVPKDILSVFEKQFKNTDDFDKPEITTIVPIKLFDSVKEAALTKGVANVFKNVFKRKDSIHEQKNNPIIQKTVNPQHSITICEKTEYSSTEDEVIKDPIKRAKRNLIFELANLRNQTLVSNPDRDEDYKSAEEPDEINVEESNDNGHVNEGSGSEITALN